MSLIKKTSLWIHGVAWDFICKNQIKPELIDVLRADLTIHKSIPIRSFSAAVTNICNAKCVFCAYPKTEMKRGVMSLETYSLGLEAWKKEGGKFIDLTPTVGDPLIDPTLAEKIRMAMEAGMSVSLTTNAILLSGKSLKLIEAGLTHLFLSIPSFDPEIYRKVYGVNRVVDVMGGVFEFLSINQSMNHPVEVMIRFRNAEKPSSILKSEGFKYVVSPFLWKKIKIRFTPGFDNWGGIIDDSSMVGTMKLRSPIQSNAPCESLFGLSMRHDGALRACGCRFVSSDDDDLIVGHIRDGFGPALKESARIAHGFLDGVRPRTCQNCTLYHPAIRRP